MLKNLLQLISICALLSISGCSASYVFKQGYYQIKLLHNSVYIEKALAKNLLSNEQREKVMLINDVKQFAAEVVGLNVGKRYSKINPTWDRLANIVIGCNPLRFEPYTWWFPIVGSFPYLGFFELPDAEAELKKLKDKGMDIYLRQVDAYSTIGYFNDPIWPQMLERSDRSLIEVIIHELSHATVYFNSKTSFNESFANFVGKTAALEYIEKKFGKESDIYKESVNGYADEKIFTEFMHKLYDELDKLYKSDLSDEDKIQQKQLVINAHRDEYREIPFYNKGYKKFNFGKINNAYIISFQTYNVGQEEFADLLKKVNGDWKEFIKRVGVLKNEKEPLEELKKLVES